MIKDLFLKAIQYPEPLAAGSNEKQRNPYKDIRDFFLEEATRQPQTLRYGPHIFTFWMAGIRPINFVVELEGVREIVGFVAD